MSDRDLVARLVEGDERAFEELYAEYGACIERHVARIVRSDAAQDLAHVTQILPPQG